MATNRDLIIGEQYAITGGNKKGGFFDLQEAVTAGIPPALQGVAQYLQKSADKFDKNVAEAQAKTAAWLNKMKGNISGAGLSSAQQQQVSQFLMAQKRKYISAANEIGKLKSTDPMYANYLQIMQGVNDSFVNLKDQISAFKTAQGDYVDGFRNGILSNSNPYVLKRAGFMFDPETVFGINEGGGIYFNYDNKNFNFSDFQQPPAKAFKAADAILKLTERVTKTRKPVSDYLEQSIRLQLEDLFRNDPNAYKSIAADKLLTPTLMKGIDYDKLNNIEDADELRNEVIDQIVNAIKAAAKKSTPPPSGDGDGGNKPMKSNSELVANLKDMPTEIGFVEYNVYHRDKNSQTKAPYMFTKLADGTIKYYKKSDAKADTAKILDPNNNPFGIQIK